MGVQADAVAASQRRGVAHQRRRDREGRAGCQHDLLHRAGRPVVEARDHALAVGEDGVLVLDAVIGRQPAAALPQRHRSARGHEPHAEGARRLHLVVDPAAVREEVGVVEHGGAARERQLRHAHQARGPERVRVAPAPDRVVDAQPAEQVRVLGRGQRTRQRLVEMVVGVDQAGQHDLSGRVEHGVGRLRQRVGRPDGLDDAVAREQAAPCDLARPIVHRHQDRRVSYQHRAHGSEGGLRARAPQDCARPAKDRFHA